MTEILHSILADPGFTPVERDWIMKFNDEVARRIQLHGVNFGITMFSITDAINLDLTSVHKEGPFMFALWVTLLNHFKAYLTLADMKYQTLDQFIQAYDGWFQQESEAEIINLWQVANWMNILFKMITARKNKGLAMQVVPKLIEGWEVKYVTGSGQTRFTANRVHVFEVEGNTKANHRSKFKSGKRRTEGRRISQPSSREIAGMMPKKRRKPRKKVDDDFVSSEEEMQYVYNFQQDSSDMEEEDDELDGEDIGMNDEIKEVFESFAAQRYQRDDSNYSDMDLVRDISSMCFDDVPLKRDVSWKEIPTTSNGGVAAAPEFMQCNAPEYIQVSNYYYSNMNEIVNNPALPSLAINEMFYGYHM
jgi:hypothetical protein